MTGSESLIPEWSQVSVRGMMADWLSSARSWIYFDLFWLEVTKPLMLKYIRVGLAVFTFWSGDG